RGCEQAGPLATHPTDWMRGGCSLPQNYYGPPVRVDAGTGAITKNVSPSTCSVQDIAPSGNYMCAIGLDCRSPSVRRPDGSESWKASGRWTILVSFLCPHEPRPASPPAHL